MDKPFWQNPIWHIVALGLLTLATRLPFRSQILFNWDSVNFALGILDFDVVKHRPHPPGYILYIGLTRGVTWLTGDPAISLVWLSIGAGMVWVCLIYLLGRCLGGPADAFSSALLLLTSPMVWFYNEIASTYTLEGFFSTAIAYACYQVLSGSTRWAYLNAGLLGLAGGFRQTTLIFMLPLTLYAMTRLPWRHWLGAGALTVSICLGWGLTLLAQSGGLEAYLAALRQLMAMATAPSPLVDLVAPLFYGAHLTLLLLPGYWLGLYPASSRGAHPTWERWFVLLWIGPGLMFIAWQHVGQSGYLLFVLPAIFIYTPGLLRGALERLQTLRPGSNTRSQATIEQKMILTTLTLALLASAAFVVVGHQLIQIQDDFWQPALRLSDRYAPSQTVVLTKLARGRGFRHASYYLPDYPVYAFVTAQLESPVAVTGPGLAGWIFQSHRGEDNYDLNPAHHRLYTRLDLPPAAMGLLVTDRQLIPTLSTLGGDRQPLNPAVTHLAGGLIYVDLPAGAEQLVVSDGQLEVR